MPASCQDRRYSKLAMILMPAAKTTILTSKDGEKLMLMLLLPNTHFQHLPKSQGIITDSQHRHNLAPPVHALEEYFIDLNGCMLTTGAAHGSKTFKLASLMNEKRSCVS